LREKAPRRLMRAKKKGPKTISSTRPPLFGQERERLNDPKNFNLSHSKEILQSLIISIRLAIFNCKKKRGSAC